MELIDKSIEEPFLIPIDGAIKEFHQHLNSHDRTILSASFGDGKSYFLSNFIKDKEVSEEYEFITIFPVNYQVADNKDIFELIKRDILLQMFMNGIIEPEDELRTLDALALYVQNEPLSFLEGFIPLISSFDIPEDYVKAAAAAKACKGIYDKIKQKVELYKKRDNNTIVEEFFTEIEKNPIVGADAISRLIREGIENFKQKHKGKKVVLVIEDMDRIDPAHLFRILNVLSAHIDYCYRLGIRPDNSIKGNKFGFDKIVLVLDYRNLEKIYAHFYGNECSFLGYIDKFCSSNYFSYSLQKERENLIYKRILQNTRLPLDCIKNLIKPSEITGKTIRQIVKAIEDTERQIIYVPEVHTNDGRQIELHTGILQIIAILRKLGIDELDIQERIFDSLSMDKKDGVSALLFAAPYINIMSKRPATASFRYSESRNGNYAQIDAINDDGSVQITTYNEANENRVVDNQIRNAIRKMMDEMVSK